MLPYNTNEAFYYQIERTRSLTSSATSGDMNGFIFFSQVITSPIYMRLLVNAIKSGHYRYSVGYVKAASFGFLPTSL